MDTTENNLFDKWFDETQSCNEQVRVLRELEAGRKTAFPTVVNAIRDHLISLEIIEKRGGFEKSADVLRNRLPKDKKARSGLLGEILATEYVQQKTKYAVPIKRLRYRDTRDLAMRGDDVLGFRRTKSRIKVLKVEAKSRGSLATSAIKEARDGLAKHRGRPNPESLAFIECILRMHDRDDEAELPAQLQQASIRARDIRHMLFTLSGNDPGKLLEANRASIRKGIDLVLCGCHVPKHGDFVKSVFENSLKTGDSDGTGGSPH